jgi:hypothetical protein
MAAACGDIYSVELLLNQNASIGMHDPVRSKKESFQHFVVTSENVLTAIWEHVPALGLCQRSLGYCEATAT